MQKRASSYINQAQDNGRSGQTAHNSTEQRRRADKNIFAGSENHAQKQENEKSENLMDEKQDSTFILLILMILLSQGETDDKLLLALLYLLL